jgi:hypothetical protein
MSLETSGWWFRADQLGAIAGYRKGRVFWRTTGSSEWVQRIYGLLYEAISLWIVYNLLRGGKSHYWVQKNALWGRDKVQVVSKER